MEKNRKLKLFSSEKDRNKHKKIPVLRAGKINLGQKVLMGRWFLDLPCRGYSSLFIRQLTGKKQAFESFFIGFCGLVEIPTLLREIAAQTLQIPYFE